MAVGLISEAEFKRCVNDLFTISEKLQDGWDIKNIGDHVYLYKRSAHLVDTTSLMTMTIEGENSEDIEDLGEEDTACFTERGANSCHTVIYEYHILYSDSYSVPVLYFNVSKSDGRLVPLDEIWHMIPEYYRDRLQSDRWTFLTQQEHPYLGKPFYYLHPCHTGALMSCVANIDQSATPNYLIGWLSAVGPVVNLEMPLQYGLAATDRTK